MNCIRRSFNLGTLVAIYIFLASLIIGSTAHSDLRKTLMMPTELVNLAEANGYKQISDFYDVVPSAWNPPFVYGVDPESDELSSVAFWGRKTLDSIDNTDSTYLLIATKGLNDMYFSLQRVLWFWPMGGLSVVKDTTINLKDFRYLNDFESKGPDTILANVNLIKIENETSTDLLIFHDSTWFDYATWDW